MENGLKVVLKPEFLKGYRDKSPSEIQKAPLSILNFLNEAQINQLIERRLSTAGDLVAERNTSAVVGIQIDPELLEKLICLLLYPQHDPGPTCTWNRLFQKAPLDVYLNFPQNPFHTQFGPVFYRGRLDGTARVLVIGQDPATDETLAGRVFVGRAGQIAQNFLNKLGLTRSYLMFNTFLFGVQSRSITSAMVTDDNIMAYRNEMFDQAAANNALTAIIAFGKHANTSVMNWPGRDNLLIVHLTHPTAPSGVASNWNNHFAMARSAIAPDNDGKIDSTPYSETTAIPSIDIPRRDLPYGIPPWHGTGGKSRSHRVNGNFESQIAWTAP